MARSDGEERWRAPFFSIPGAPFALPWRLGGPLLSRAAQQDGAAQVPQKPTLRGQRLLAQARCAGNGCWHGHAERAWLHVLVSVRAAHDGDEGDSKGRLLTLLARTTTVRLLKMG